MTSAELIAIDVHTHVVPSDRMAWPLYEVIAEYKLPAIFHNAHSGKGPGMRCDGGL